MTAEPPVLKAPFPYPGGKSRVADLIWERFGDVANYVEPFCGSAAVLLRRPASHFADGYRVETLNDRNHYLVNFWRAVAADPARVAVFADRPVTEADLHANHLWLVRSAAADQFRRRVTSDPRYSDPEIAGRWLWGACCWIGAGWCTDHGATADGGRKEVMPLLDHSPKGVTANRKKKPNIGQQCSTGGVGVNGVGSGPALSRQVPDLTSGGCGDAAPAGILQIQELPSGVGRGDAAAHSVAHGRPNLADAFDIGRGVNGGANQLKRPNFPDAQSPGLGVLSNPLAGTCEARREWLIDWMRRLADRLRLVRTCYGHWSRICDSESTLARLGTTGVFLDPPYPARRGDNGKKSRDDNLYAGDKSQDLNGLRDEVLSWCRKWGVDPQIRVAVCGYEGDGYEALEAEGWSVHEWEASGGYANQRRAGKKKSENAARERIWFNPACLPPDRTPSLFDHITD